LRKHIAGRRSWLRSAATLVAAVAVVLVALLAISAGKSKGTYEVRAIFDDAGNIIPGENVKIDGVKVGTVGSVEPTPQAKAAVVLRIDNKGFADFRADASCQIRPQALIGEKFVDCLPTQPRVEGAPLAPALQKIPSGQEGAGQYLLPVTNTHSPVDVDLLGDINRLPVRQRFTIILNELGAGLASRGSDLREVIQRANPALQELDRVLAILAGENKVLAKLAVDSDIALKPFARVRRQFADFIAQSNTVAQASARHLTALERNLIDFPPFLRQLGPSSERIGRFAEQTIPVAENLKAAAPGINEAFTHLAPFSNSSIAFFKSLGSTAAVSGPALASLRPLLARLRALGTQANPFASNAAELLTSLRDTGGLERLMDFIFLGANASNGYDALGHFLRAEALAAACITYTVTPAPACGGGKLFNTGSASGAAGATGTTASLRKTPIPRETSLVMARTLAMLKGATPAQAIARYPGAAPTSAEVSGAGAPSGSAAAGAPVSGTSAGTTYYAPSSEEPAAGGMLLNYLLGG
jgi:phospholipid/cholesterol/gamma-HCH transport system substrate-binding protein